MFHTIKTSHDIFTPPVKLTLKGAFTLIELSIVLVIIGLIVGGVLVGRDLIASAEARSVITDLERFNTAANTFEGKYNCVPGDCANATSFWPQDANCAGYGSLTTPATATCNGNGDGTIEDYGQNSQGVQVAAYSYHAENFLFWQQLALAGLIPGSYNGGANGDIAQSGINVPTTHISGGCYSMVWTSTSFGALGAVMFGPIPSWDVYSVGLPNATAPCINPLMSPLQARNIDSKIDDGLPATGNVQTFPNANNNGGTCVANNGFYNPYLSTPVITYNTTLSGPQCPLVIKTQF